MINLDVTVDSDGPSWQESLRLAAEWTTKRSLIRTREHGFVDSTYKWLDRYDDWRGAFRGEYIARERRWDIFCPVWHGGQGIKGLALAAELLDDEAMLDTARQGADFILRYSVQEEGPDDGLILAYEAGSAGVNTSGILEALDGLFELSRVTGDKRYQETAIRALRWVQRTVFIPDEGLFYDDYLPGQGILHGDPRGWRKQFGFTWPGRPLLDDGAFLTGYRLTGDESFKDVAVRVAERLLAGEHPPGNWHCFPPAFKDSGVIHPRHGYWAGRPMWMVYRETGDERFLDCCRRSARWYVNAMRLDGGIFRHTDQNFNTTSFGHAISGIACAVIHWLDLKREFGDTEWDEPIHRALTFCRGVQFRKAEDENLQGAILEKVLPPDGTDRVPWHLRDVGTFFYLQALSIALRDAPDLLV